MKSYQPSLPCPSGAIGLLPGCNGSMMRAPQLLSRVHGELLSLKRFSKKECDGWVLEVLGPRANSPHSDRTVTCSRQPGLGSGSQAADGGGSTSPWLTGGAAPFQMAGNLWTTPSVWSTAVSPGSGRWGAVVSIFILVFNTAEKVSSPRWRGQVCGTWIRRQAQL